MTYCLHPGYSFLLASDSCPTDVVIFWVIYAGLHVHNKVCATLQKRTYYMYIYYISHFLNSVKHAFDHIRCICSHACMHTQVHAIVTGD